MNISTWQFLVLLCLVSIGVGLYNIDRLLNKFNERLFWDVNSLYGQIESLVKEVRELRWTISGGPNDYDDEQPPNKYEETIANNIQKIREDLLSIRSRITSETSSDEDLDEDL